MREVLRLLGFVVAIVLLLFLGDRSAQAATFAVNSTTDAADVNPGDGVCADATGLCTVRAAVMEANALAGNDTITLPPGTYTLTIPGDVTIASNLTINGSGAPATIITRQGTFDRVFHVVSGLVTIADVTLTGGNKVFGGGGGGILNGGVLTLNASIVGGNSAGGGGNNDNGAGILNEAGAVMTLTNSTVHGNALGGFRFGGGIANFGSLTLSGSTVSGNNTTGSGGGISNAGLLTLTNSTISGNGASCGGGGIENSGTLTLDSSTVSDNAAGGGGCGGGGIRVFAGSASVRNTIVANSVSGGNCAGALSSFGHNLSSDATCGFAGPGDLNGTNPLLAPLANTGGATETHALLPGSPAIDAVPLPSCTVSTDQRGVLRPQGTGCDIGAFETVLAACVPAPSGMVAWWTMDETTGATALQDIVGGNHAMLSASPVGAAQAPQAIPGVVSGAMQFPKFGNGLSGARVSPQGALATIGSGDFTVDAWVNVPSGPANRLHYIVNKFDGVQNRGYALYVVSPGTIGNERLEFKWGDGVNLSTVQTISPLTTGQWHHVAVTLARNVGGNALDIRLYVDGGLQGQQAGTPPAFGSLVNFVFLEIGWQPGTLDEPISLDELEIFNVALPQSDIQSIYNAGAAGKCKCTSGGQSVDLTVTGTGAVFGAGSGVGATVGNPLIIDYAIQSCSGHEMFLIVNASILPNPVYFDGSAWLPVPTPLSLITPFVTGGPQTSNGLHTLFSGNLPQGTYDVYLVCDLVQNGHLDVTFPPLCLNGAFDHLPLIVQ